MVNHFFSILSPHRNNILFIAFISYISNSSALPKTAQQLVIIWVLAPLMISIIRKEVATKKHLITGLFAVKSVLLTMAFYALFKLVTYGSVVIIVLLFEPSMIDSLNNGTAPLLLSLPFLLYPFLFYLLTPAFYYLATGTTLLQHRKPSFIYVLLPYFQFGIVSLVHNAFGPEDTYYIQFLNLILTISHVSLHVALAAYIATVASGSDDNRLL